MQSKEICDLIVKIENQLDVNAIKLNEVHAWPVIRLTLWSKLSQVQDQVAQIGNGDASFIEDSKFNIFHFIFSKLIYRTYRFIKAKALRVKDFLLQIVNQTTLIFTGTKDILFVSHMAYYSEIVDGKRFSRIIDPVYEEISKEYSCLKISFDKFSVPKRYRSYFFAPLRDNKTHFSEQEHVEIENFLRQISRIDKRINIDIRKDIINRLQKIAAYKDLSKKILLQFRPRAIILSVYYDNRHLGMLWAAYDMHIPTIDLQHGKQGKYQAMYSHWTKIPKEGYKTIPTWFWNWGEASADHIMKWQPHRSTHRSMVAGFPWMNKWKSLNTNGVLQKKINRKYIVLITLQGPTAGNPDILPNFIVRAIEESSDEYFWIIRPHYNSQVSKRVAVDKLVDVDSKKYSINIGENAQLYELLSISNLHMTAFSSVCYEATGFNVPTIIWSKEGQEIYSEEILNHIFFYANNYKALLHSMEKALAMEKVLQHGYINSSSIRLAELVKAALI
ncbi:MAG: hypothetical protein ABUK01_00760 [Leptospirales bacterium]